MRTQPWSGLPAGALEVLAHRLEIVGARTWLILPTYDEAGNLRAVVEAARAALEVASPGDHAILVVDDDSPDGTGAIADRLAAERPEVSVLHRPGKGGLGPAYVAGFAQALAGGAELVLQMDADLSHDPVDVIRLIARARAGADLVIGSRYVRGGGIETWNLGRRIVSAAGCLYARLVLRVPVRDLTGGFKCFRADALRAIDYCGIRANGYAFQVELTDRALRAGLRVEEIPIVFHGRREGQSEMTRGIVVEAAWRVPQLRVRRCRALTAVRSGRPRRSAGSQEISPRQRCDS